MADELRQPARPVAAAPAEDDSLARDVGAALAGVLGALSDALRDPEHPLPEVPRRRLEGAQSAATEAQRLVGRLASARAEAEAGSRAKDEFIAMTSHELRTPLGAILIWAQLLKTEDMDPPAVSRAVGMIERSTKTLAQLVDDLLDASRIIAGKLTFEKRPLELTPVVESAVEAMAPAAQAKDVRIERSLPAALPPVSGDPGRLQQVVANLLANAVKFTPEGGRIEVTVDHVEASARIRVSDTGAGIAAASLPYIFEPFRQADSTTTRKEKGLGLGLAIARHIVEQHGGTIEVDSPGEGLGCTFTVMLPLIVGAAACEAARPLPEPAPPGSLQGLTVLVVDDEEDARDAMVVLLGQAGARVHSVATAGEAVDVLVRERPDVVLSDVAMPGEDGYALIRRIRSLPADKGGRVPAAALTAYATLEDRARALRAGFDEHLPKPVDPGRLIGVITSLAGDPRPPRGRG